MTFSGTSTAASGAVCDGAGLGAADLSALRSRLSAFLADGGCGALSDAERVDAIRAAEELAC
ncbi:MAG: hypothetical protein ACI379_14320, partial [Nocardioides sp.]|uniref:hypothetical protein n=1 Tax=Nocardioides sp. TaxID=35761 RepID=UPI003F08B9A0